MTAYLSPGVYVKEVSSGIFPIAGVGTSTAGFIGIIPSQDSSSQADSPQPQPIVLKKDTEEIKGTGNENVEFPVQEPFLNLNNYRFSSEEKEETLQIQQLKITKDLVTVKFDKGILGQYKSTLTYSPQGKDSPSKTTMTMEPTPPSNPPNNDSHDSFQFKLQSPFQEVIINYQFCYGESKTKLDIETFTIQEKLITVKFEKPVPQDQKLQVIYHDPELEKTQTSAASKYKFVKVEKEVVGKGDGAKKEFKLSFYPVSENDVVVNVNKEVTSSFTVKNDETEKTSKITFTNDPPKKDDQILVDYFPLSVESLDVKLCTNFTEFKKSFGDFLDNEGQSMLAHAVYVFFNNGGTRCFVTWVASESDIDKALEKFEAIDEIAILAVPGCTEKTVLESLGNHCQKLGDRFAIFDTPKEVKDITTLKPGEGDCPQKTDYAALYYPWIKVFDPPTQKANPKGDGLKIVPPSGHIAGIYARVDTQRGVHKAPANEAIMGALGLQVDLSRAKQDGLNPQGVNCIRNLNGNTLVWGARTWGGDGNGEFKYINIRRLFNYLRESIDEGTQWAVFEPNSPELWAKIRRSVTAFLTMVWRSGALFGATPEEAFFVKCDEETNPPDVRDAGRLIVKVGVAVVKPAEFVIFELSQWSGGK